MTKIKAIFFDIDGTIRSFKTKTIPENTKETLKKLREKGIKIFVATGRAPFHTKFLDDLLDFKFDLKEAAKKTVEMLLKVIKEEETEMKILIGYDLKTRKSVVDLNNYNRK